MEIDNSSNRETKRQACFSLGHWKIMEALDRGETIDIPSLGPKITSVQKIPDENPPVIEKNYKNK